MKIPFPKKRGAEITEKIFEIEPIKATDIIAPAAIEIRPDYLRLGERLAKTFFIFSYPRYLSTGWFSRLLI